MSYPVTPVASSEDTDPPLSGAPQISNSGEKFESQRDQYVGSTFRESNDLSFKDNARLHVGNTYINYLDQRHGGHDDDQRDQQRADLQKVLYYQTMNKRKAQLESTVTASFDWVWKTILSDWLSNEEALFWITGKPGSGKSTLMKYLSDSGEARKRLPRTRKRSWLVAQFYYDFRAGSGIANTVPGMLRTLLHQLVGQSEDFTANVWLLHGNNTTGDWTNNEEELMATLIECSLGIESNILAAIDGLDEHYGFFRHLLGRLTRLQKGTRMKLLLASRPELMAKRILRDAPTIYMQDHNTATIKDYIDTASDVLSMDEQDEMQTLWDQIETEAEGVIVWAKFVVDELILRKISGATFFELQGVLNTYPSELEGIYEEIWKKLDEKQKLHAAVAVFLVTAHSELIVDDFFVAWCTIIEDLDPDVKFEKDFQTRQFLDRMYALLGGLLEFFHGDNSESEVRGRRSAPGQTLDEVDEFERCGLSATTGQSTTARGFSGTCGSRCVVRVVHKTLATYLPKNKEISHLIDNTIRPKFGTPLRVVDAILLKEADNVLSDHLAEIHISLELRNRNNTQLAMLKELRRLNLSGTWSHRFKYLIRAIVRYPNYLGTTATQAAETLRIIKLPLLLLHSILSRHYQEESSRYQCACANDDFSLSPTDIEARYHLWHIRCLAYHGQYMALELALRVEYALDTKFLDPVLVTLVRLYETHTVLRPSWARSIDALLCRTYMQSYHLTLYFICDFPEKPKFLTLPDRFDRLAGWPAFVRCPWRPSTYHSLLCYWAWDLVETDENREKISSSLQLLIKKGLSINLPAYENGTVMHALFEPSVPKDQHRQGNFLHFSKHKFDLLKAAGFDFAKADSSEYGSILRQAKRLRAAKLRRTMEWSNLIALDSVIEKDLIPIHDEIARASRIKAEEQNSGIANALQIPRLSGSVVAGLHYGSRPHSRRTSFDMEALSIDIDP